MRASSPNQNRNRTPQRSAVPLLLNGDHLSVPEFERRYEAMEDDRKAELIEGVVVMSPPISLEHADSDGSLGTLLGIYASDTPNVIYSINPSVRLDGRNEYHPDAMLRIAKGGFAQTKVAPSGIFEGRPELVAEIALSSHAYDLHEKKAGYQRNQIPEYIVWEVMDARLHWFSLEQGEYVPLVPRRNSSIICSKIFPGLWIDTAAVLGGKGSAGDARRTLDRGLKSAEYKAFVKKLAAS